MICTKCALGTKCRGVLAGSGSNQAKLLIIGSYPSDTEDLIQKAWAGMHMKLLQQMLITANITVETFMTYTVCCYPGKNEPKHDEILSCRHRLLELYDHLSPEWIVLAGDVAKKYCNRLFPVDAYITDPAYLVKTGGKSSPFYLRSLNILIELGQKIENK